jgi:nucleolar protein 56
MRIFSNIIGAFAFDSSGIKDEVLFSSIEGYQNREEAVNSLKSRHPDAKELDEKELKQVLSFLADKKYFQNFYLQNHQLTRTQVKNSVKDDTLVIQAINSIDETDKAINLLSKRLREWYELYNPEFSKHEQNHEQFVAEILKNSKQSLLEKINFHQRDSMGADLSETNAEAIMGLAEKINSLFQLRKSTVDYISTIMDSLCPNIKTVCTPLVAARLLEHAGSLKRLSELPSSTIQILGAETALFRHMKTGARPPRHGVIVHHPLIAKATEKMHGKVARSLSDKITIAAKIDYFKGQFRGDKLLKDLEAKFEKK